MPYKHDALIAWKSHVGISISAEKKCLKATANGWGRSGALSDALLTRQGDVEGFLAELPNTGIPLFIGFSTKPGSLYDKGRAHQEELDFSVRLSADGTLSYQSAAKMQQFYHAQSIEGDAMATVVKGDAIGMRLTPDRNGFVIIRRNASDAAEPSTASSAAPAGLRARPYTVLKTVKEVISFPMKVMVVFGGAGAQLGPVSWLHGRRVSAQGSRMGVHDGAATSTSVGAPAAVVKGRSAADLLGLEMIMDGNRGGCLLLSAPAEGSWAAGKVQAVSQGSSSSVPGSRKPVGQVPSGKLPSAISKTDKEAKMRAVRAALQPKAVARGARLIPRSSMARCRALTSAPARAEVPRVKAEAAEDSGSTSIAMLTEGSLSDHGAVPDSDALADESEEVDAHVPISELLWTLVRLARHSPFTAKVEYAALRTVAHGQLTITVSQLRNLAAAMQRLMPRGGISDTDPAMPPPPPPPPPLSHLQEHFAAESTLVSPAPFFSPPRSCMDIAVPPACNGPPDEASNVPSVCSAPPQQHECQGDTIDGWCAQQQLVQPTLHLGSYVSPAQGSVAIIRASSSSTGCGRIP